MTVTLIQQACDSVAEKLYAFAATLPMVKPPAHVLAWEQQCQLYLALKANPLGLAVLKIEKGNTAFDAWVLTMEQRCATLGAIGVNLGDLSMEEKEDVMAAAQEVAAPQMETGEAPNGGE